MGRFDVNYTNPNLLKAVFAFMATLNPLPDDMNLVQCADGTIKIRLIYDGNGITDPAWIDSEYFRPRSVEEILEVVNERHNSLWAELVAVPDWRPLETVGEDYYS